MGLERTPQLLEAWKTAALFVDGPIYFINRDIIPIFASDQPYQHRCKVRFDKVGAAQPAGDRLWFLDAQGDDRGGVPELQRPSSRSTRRALNAAPSGSTGLGRSQNSPDSCPDPIRTSPARSRARRCGAISSGLRAMGTILAAIDTARTMTPPRRMPTKMAFREYADALEKMAAIEFDGWSSFVAEVRRRSQGKVVH